MLESRGKNVVSSRGFMVGIVQVILLEARVEMTMKVRKQSKTELR
jgi:hypothetical protein